MQLARLPSLLARCVPIATASPTAIGPVDGLQPRRLPDPVGAGGSSLTWFARRRADGRAGWSPRSGRGRAGGADVRRPARVRQPGRAEPEGGRRRTRPAVRGPRTLVSRTLTVGIGPAFTVEDCAAVAAAVRKVARHVLQ